MRLVFFGLPLAALLLERDGHDLALVAVSRTDTPGLRRARRVFGDRLLLRPSAKDPALLARVRGLAPDLLVSWFWTTRLPMPLVRAARLGGIGAHPSLLPRHRGPDPTYWAIASGDEETGVTVHRIEADYDTGAMLAQARVRIAPAWNAWQLARALDGPSLRLLRATVLSLARGEPVPGLAQDPALATLAPAPDDQACALVWSWPTPRVLRHVRALAPAPGAWTEVAPARASAGDRRQGSASSASSSRGGGPYREGAAPDDPEAGRLVTVLRAAPAPRFPALLSPGEGVSLDGHAVVRTGDGAVVLLEGEIDGRPAAAKDLAALFLSTLPLR